MYHHKKKKRFFLEEKKYIYILDFNKIKTFMLQGQKVKIISSVLVLP